LIRLEIARSEIIWYSKELFISNHFVTNSLTEFLDLMADIT